MVEYGTTMISEPLAHTLARIGVSLLGATCLLFPLVAWLAHMRGATNYPARLKKGRSLWVSIFFIGFGALCIVVALFPTRIPTTTLEIVREQIVTMFLPAYALLLIACVVRITIEPRKTLAWWQDQWKFRRGSC
jgi:hypothetical protein